MTPPAVAWWRVAVAAIILVPIRALLEQVELRRLELDIFSLLACLMPAISEVVSMIGLRHLPNWGEIVGLLCISLAVAFAQYRPGVLDRKRKHYNQ